MANEDWKGRLLDEYRETKARYNKLKAYNRKKTVESFTSDAVAVSSEVEEYRSRLMEQQQSTMGRYLEILELRLTLENIEYKD